MARSHTAQTSVETATSLVTILVADDDLGFCRLLSLLLSQAGYQVLIVNDGHNLVRVAQECRPSLILIDLMMPQIDGYEALRQLRNDTRTAHLPVIIVTARAAAADLVCGFEVGADDYITKPVIGDELLARIRGQLRRVSRRPVHSPLTGLPGNALLLEEIRYRLGRAQPFALLHLDLSAFKAFNDTYGFARGDRAIHLLAALLRETIAGDPSVFLGHIGGDDFAVLCEPERVAQLAHTIIFHFTLAVPTLYDEADRARGFIDATDRDGVPCRFPLMGLIIGGAIQNPGRFSDLKRSAAAPPQ